MQRIILKSKLHKARITEANLYYDGSLTIDQDIMDLADIVPYEKVLVVNINNGERFETYAIPGERGSKTFGLNGAAARKGTVNDQVIVMTFAHLEDKELKNFKSDIFIFNDENELRDKIEAEIV